MDFNILGKVDSNIDSNYDKMLKFISKDSLIW